MRAARCQIDRVSEYDAALRFSSATTHAQIRGESGAPSRDEPESIKSGLDIAGATRRKTLRSQLITEQRVFEVSGKLREEWLAFQHATHSPLVLPNQQTDLRLS